MNPIFAIAFAFALSGCVTTSGSYTVSAQDSNGNNLTNNLNLMAVGSGIYTVRNALCQKYPKSIVVIKDAKTGENLKSESPYQCS